MTYNKPTIEVLGEAVRVINGGKPNETVSDSQLTGINQPAYELDE